MQSERAVPQESMRQAPLGLIVVTVVLLSLSPALTKAGGLLFFVFLAWGFWVALRWPRFAMASSLPRDWLIIATAALVFRAAATLWWNDSWGGRHFEGRFFLMALAAWCLIKACSLSPWQKAAIDLALALACWVALVVVWMVGRDTPTNALPWAAGVSFVVCVLLGRLFEAQRSWPVRGALLVSVMGGVAAVLLSQSRGSYGVVVCLAAALVVLSWHFALKRHGRMVWRAAVVLAVGVVVIAAIFPQLYRAPQERVQVAAQEASKLADELRRGQVSVSALDTSVGARLYMWVRALDEPDLFAVTGVGQRQRQAWVKDLGRQSGSEVIASLDHLHSDPLTIWFEHGLLGLASYLSVALGLVWLAWRARMLGAGAVMALAGMAFMHITAGLTNFNTIHNFYGVMLSLCILLTLWLATPDSQQAAS
jgi:O-antigen ligase